MTRGIFLAFALSACTLSTAPISAQDESGIFGAWDLTVETRQGSRPSWVKLFNEQGMPVVEFVGSSGGKSRATNVQVTGDSFQWTTGETVYQATLAGDRLTGTLARGNRSSSFTGVRAIRRTDVSGTWDVEVDLGDRTFTRVLKLEHDGDQITGTYGGGEAGDTKLSNASLKDDQLTYSVDIETGNGELTITHTAKVRGDSFIGTSEVDGNDARGELTATRRREWAEPIALFNGTDLSNWEFQRTGGENQWQVVDGVMVNRDRGWNIFSKQKFQDYKLRVDVKVPPRGNSGIYINGRYEVQVEDSYGKQPSEGSMGAIYGRAIPTANPSRPADEWQTFEITFVDYWATVTLNDTKIVDNVLIEGITGGALDSLESEPGPVMLQGDHGHIEYRNIVLTPLKQ